MAEPDIDDLERRMVGAVEVLRKEFAGLRTGRASIGLLEPITVDAYGTKMPLNQVGTIGVPDARMLTVQVWDRSLVSAVEKAIREFGPRPQPDDRRPARPRADSPALGRAPHRDGARSPTAMPSRRAWRCATSAATAWTC